MTSAEWEGLVRAALYPVIFSSDPVEAVDRVARDAAGRGKPEMIRALKQALASSVPLARLLPQDHDEESVRRYLSALLARLESAS